MLGSNPGKSFSYTQNIIHNQRHRPSAKQKSEPQNNQANSASYMPEMKGKRSSRKNGDAKQMIMVNKESAQEGVSHAMPFEDRDDSKIEIERV